MKKPLMKDTVRAGVAVLVEILSDNRNRTVADIRHIFSKNAGNLGEAGCVAWMFEKRGMIVFDRAKVDEEKLMEIALDAGARDVREAEKEFEVITEPANFEAVKKKLEDAQLQPSFAEVTMVPAIHDPPNGQRSPTDGPPDGGPGRLRRRSTRLRQL